MSQVNTCHGRCGHISVDNTGCQCDNQCVKVGDCCPDYSTICLPSPSTTTQKPLMQSCQNRCTAGKKSFRFLRQLPVTKCYCDEDCVKVGDCCSDYDQYCQNVTLLFIGDNQIIFIKIQRFSNPYKSCLYSTYHIINQFRIQE